ALYTKSVAEGNGTQEAQEAQEDRPANRLFVPLVFCYVPLVLLPCSRFRCAPMPLRSARNAHGANRSRATANFPCRVMTTSRLPRAAARRICSTALSVRITSQSGGGSGGFSRMFP